MKATTRVSGKEGRRVSEEAGGRVRTSLSGWFRVGMVRIMRAFLLTLLPAYSLTPLHAQTSLTIYNDGRVLVRRAVSANVPKGASTQRLGLGALDPGPLFSLDSSVTLERLSYDGAVDEASVLRR